MRITGIIGVVLLAAACGTLTGVVIDTALLESAEALPTGHAKVIIYPGGGIDVNKMGFTPDIDHNEYNNTNGGGLFFVGIKAGLGLGRGFEIVMSSATGSGPFPGKASLKYTVKKTGNWAFAVMPGYYDYEGDAPYNTNWNYDPRPFLGEYRTAGWEWPFLATYTKPHKNFSVNLSARYCSNRTKYKRVENPGFSYTTDPETLVEGAFNSSIFAFNGGICLRWKYLVIRPEVGVFVYQVGGTTGSRYLPVLNFGAGLEFN